MDCKGYQHKNQTVNQKLGILGEKSTPFRKKVDSNSLANESHNLFWRVLSSGQCIGLGSKPSHSNAFYGGERI